MDSLKYSGNTSEDVIFEHEYHEQPPKPTGRVMDSLSYSGNAPEDLAFEHERYHALPRRRTVNKRRHLRVSCNASACIRTKKATVLVEIVDISRSGMCFRSAEHFYPGTAVSVATHYIAGGQNIFQNGTIVRVHSPSGTTCAEYGVEFNQTQ
jgi:hypothetical protein